jgi:glucosylceramidase
VVEIAGGSYRRNAEFFVLGHAARFVRPGARRIGSTGAGHPAVRHVAFVNPDGTRVLIVLNTAEQDERLGVGDGERAFTLPVPAGALVTVTWPGDPPPAAGRSRLDPSGWTIDASSVPAHPCCTGDLPQHAIDGDPRTRWTTGEPQRPGQWLTIDLGARRRFDTLVIDDGHTGDHPRGYAVHAGDDPGALGPPIATGSGTRGALTITFAPVTAQHVRIVQTGTSGSWWSVHDLALLARGAGRTGVRPR